MRFDKKLGKISSRKGGFTLIELLVVIAIIGILAAVVLVSLNNARIRGRDARRLSDLQAITLALELYADAHDGQYPDETNGDTGVPNAATFDAIGAELASGGEDYIPASPTDPFAGRVYVGVISEDRDSYLLGADLEQDNQACDADYDGDDLVAGTNACEDDGASCDDVAADDVDYCICQGPDCA